jgi:PPOX class probable F420-dependent enzyme
MEKLSEGQQELFKGRNYAQLATICPDGHPAVSPVWVHLEDGYIVINSAEGRLKIRNMKSDPRVGISVFDMEDPYRMVSVRGRVVEMTHEGADEHIDVLAKKYLGVDSYPGHQPGETRVKVRIEPEIVAGMRT